MPTFGLIDGNSFYCSAEQAFAPDLRSKPLVVLSNNDGCAIARTPQAKALGIRMGEPWHLVRKRPEGNSISWRSSNYALYGDMSRRVYDVLTERVPAVEPYSIDEMFLDLEGIPDLDRFCRDLRRDVRQIAKIPTCIGIGHTKTLAKLANRIAKNTPALGGVCDLRCPAERSRYLADIPVAEVWGIGGRSAARLATAGVETAADLVNLDAKLVRSMLTVTGARVQAELRGMSCLSLSLLAPARQGIAVTRSFGRVVDAWNDLREAVASYTARAAEKLRAERLEAGHIAVFAHSNPHSRDTWFSGQLAAQIEPTADTGVLIGEAVRLLLALWRPGVRYFKVGVMLNDLSEAGRQSILLSSVNRPRSVAAMSAMDAVNARFGRDTLRIASTGSVGTWKGRQQNISPRYTTRVDEILLAHAF